MKWISVKDRLPTRDQRYLVHVPTGDPEKPFVGIAWWDPEAAEWSLLPPPFARSVTHWSKVPKPPA